MTDKPPLTPEEIKAGRAAAYAFHQRIDTRAALSPVIQTIETIGRDRKFIDHEAMELALQETIQHATENRNFTALESILITSAYSLNHIFHKMLQKAAAPEISPFPERMKTCIDMALKAQRQMLSSIELLARLKNPPAAVLVQHNIAQNQQVNNGIAAPAPTSGPKLTNELLSYRSYDYEAMDIGGKRAAGVPCQELEAVVVLDRADDDRG
jgi:hypothetical protein